MVKIIQPRLGFVYYLHADVGSGKVTFDAGELFMVGLLPAVLDMVHAVASSAETGVPRRVIAPGHERCEEHSNDNSCSKSTIAGNRNLLLYLISYAVSRAC